MPSSSTASLKKTLFAVVLVLVVVVRWLAIRAYRTPPLATARSTPSASVTISKRSPPPTPVVARLRAGVSGKVLNPERAPISGAQVCAWPSPEVSLPRYANRVGERAYLTTALRCHE
ncbi:MAG: hypothetical protein U0165_04470 [Polyangiaceae bacterium]